MAYKSSSGGYWSSANQTPYVAPPQPIHTSPRVTQLRAVNHATPHSGAPWNFCPSCCTPFEKDAHFCHECGMSIGNVQLATDLIPTKCACKRALKKEYKFCPGCKADVDKSWETAPTCTCGAILKIEAVACVACGKKTTTHSSKRHVG
ncbi:MAG: zinc ribbon domain-containing protein [Candidatus Uhrbacteria bacterium]|nr:zinc ribbon domain-containing protein [Candidatus Uhrbacteria bacterium]